MPTQRPTAKQQQVLDFIKGYLVEKGYSPSYREIGSAIGVTTGPVFNYLNALEVRGFITRNANESRSIKLVEVK